MTTRPTNTATMSHLEAAASRPMLGSLRSPRAPHIQPLSASSRQQAAGPCSARYARLARPTYSHIQPHSATFSHIQPHTATYSHIQPHSATFSHIQPHSATYSHIQPYSATFSHIQPHSAIFSHIQPHKAT